MGQFKKFFEWEYVISAYVLFAGIMIILMRPYDFDKHQTRDNE
jgi:hypothetical protein